MGENTQSPPKIIITNIIFLQLIFLITYGHYILYLFVCFIYIWLVLNLLQSFFKNSKNIEELGHIEYICDKIIYVTKLEQLHMYFKISIMVGFFGNFFCDEWYWYTIHQLNVELFRIFKKNGNPI